jgi:spastin
MGIVPTGYYNQMVNQQNNKTPTPENNQAYETPQGYSSPMAPGALYSNPSQYDQPRPKTQYGLGNFPVQKKTAISKNVYSRVKPEDLRIVLLYMKNSNNKYQEGLDLCGKRKYVEAQSCFNYAKSSYMNLNKLMNGNPRAYPIEFTMVISKKINEKLLLLHQSMKECSNFIKNRNTEQILRNNGKPQDVLRSLNQDMNNQNNDFNFNNNFNNANNNNFKSNTNNNDPNKKKSIHDKEEDEMDEKIESEIMVKNPGVRFNDIIGMKEMKQILYEIIVVPTIRPDLFTGIRKPQRGILLFGPPGTGKTMIAKAIASECNSTFFNISASSLTSKWVGESEKTVKSLFKIAYKKAPSIVFIDEIDSILSKRNESENEATKRLKTEFLIQFDGLGSNTNARLLVIAATNRPMDLDDALLRRLPKRVYCGPLDEEGRFEFIKKVINRVETNLSDRDIQEVAKMTYGYSNSDLKELCKEAAFQPVRELTMEQILRINKFRPLVKQDLVKAVHKIRGTLSNKIIDELLKWNEQFGGI